MMSKRTAVYCGRSQGLVSILHIAEMLLGVAGPGHIRIDLNVLSRKNNWKTVVTCVATAAATGGNVSIPVRDTHISAMN